MILTSKNTASLLLLASTISGSAVASCPQIEGKYDYKCTVQKDEDADFADVLEVAGQMIIHQKSCESYQFINLKSQIEESFIFSDFVTETERSQAKIGKSTSYVIKFTTIEHSRTKELQLDSLTAQVTKAMIRTTKNGFALKGKESSRVLGIFSKKHSKFSCRFVEQN